MQVFGLSSATAYKMYNVLGAEVRGGVINDNTEESIQGVEYGIYLIKLENGGIIKFTKKKFYPLLLVKVDKE